MVGAEELGNTKEEAEDEEDEEWDDAQVDGNSDDVVRLHGV